MIFKPAPRGKGPSKNFTWAEVIGHGRSGYAQVPVGPFFLPSGKVVTPRRNARKHARNLERLRAEINHRRKIRGISPTGINVLSWARSWTHNMEVHGARDSQHLYFQATDISLGEIRRLCPWNGGPVEFDSVANKIFRQGGFGTYPGGNRHVDSRGYRARWSDWVGWGRR